MSDRMATAMDWLAGKRKTFTTETVTYRRGSDEVELSATVGRTIFRLPAGYGVEIRIETRDFLITAADLILDGALVEPQAGDEVDRTVGAATHVYEVMSPGADEVAWEYSDGHRNTLRVHTKRIEVT